MENTNEVLADVMLSFLNFVREQKPTMVNHGEKINLFELERLVEKFKIEHNLLISTKQINYYDNRRNNNKHSGKN